jgi:two-component system, chemotaxis family, chemotaxis protein CheY
MQRRVLIVDDSMLMRQMVKRALALGEWEVVGEATNGHEAIEKYQQLLPDLVTLDITMPGCDGLEALKVIMGINPQAKVVVVSALDQTKLIAAAIRAGAHGFVVKPFSPEHLRDALRLGVEEPTKV